MAPIHIPAICDSCGAVFRSGFVAENARNITLSGNISGPCPACGDMGHIPDGIFNFVGDTIEILSAPKRTVDELSRLARIIGESRDKKRSREEVAETIRKEVPELAGLADLLPKTRAELYAFLALIVAVIAILTQEGQSGTNTTNVTVEQTINQVFIQTEKACKPNQKAEPPSLQATPRVGRNEPCPCGSGKKYKKCCGRLQ